MALCYNQSHMTGQKPKKAVKKGMETSWSGVAKWYDDLLQKEGDTYQAKVILPDLVRAMKIHKGSRVLDLACGQGFFSRAFFAVGAEVAGVDISRELIERAKEESPKEIRYFVRSAEDLAVFQDGYFEKISIVLAIQNIEAPHKVFKECARILAPGGTLYLVMNHPAFRIPKTSSWGYDEETMTQYRRIDRYMSESKVAIEMNPGAQKVVTTTSFHRPLQYYFTLNYETPFLLIFILQ
ncbi:MAG: hypothetical protein UY07_C0008G0001 [Parcubacteria group bacterium GW2011_GWA1_47_8]|nr:MAG: hypothetical protein UY07_C0008G0001 [Parcubacteria group bacterium GW2011_GWA1_47_8]